MLVPEGFVLVLPVVVLLGVADCKFLRSPTTNKLTDRMSKIQNKTFIFANLKYNSLLFYLVLKCLEPR